MTIIQNEKILSKILDLIKERLDLPLIYLFEHNNRSDFIYVVEKELNNKIVTETEIEITELINHTISLIDIREFDTLDRMNIMKNSTMIYCKNPQVKNFMESAANVDVENLIKKRNTLINRKKECGVFFLQ